MASFNLIYYIEARRKENKNYLNRTIGFDNAKILEEKYEKFNVNKCMSFEHFTFDEIYLLSESSLTQREKLYYLSLLNCLCIDWWNNIDLSEIKELTANISSEKMAIVNRVVASLIDDAYNKYGLLYKSNINTVHKLIDIAIVCIKNTILLEIEAGGCFEKFANYFSFFLGVIFYKIYEDIVD